MQMKGQVEWAIHCCSVLAHMPAGRYVATRTLAEFHKVPKEYLSKALQALSQAGLIEGTLGPTGGYRLARPAEAISLIEIVEAMEGPLGMTECSVHAGACGIEQSCGVRANWRRINDVVVAALRGVTLAEMLGPPAPLPPTPAKRIDLRLARA